MGETEIAVGTVVTATNRVVFLCAYGCEWSTKRSVDTTWHVCFVVLGKIALSLGSTGGRIKSIKYRTNIDRTIVVVYLSPVHDKDQKENGQ